MTALNKGLTQIKTCAIDDGKPAGFEAGAGMPDGDDVVALNDAFARTILEASETYLRAMSAVQEQCLGPWPCDQNGGETKGFASAIPIGEGAPAPFAVGEQSIPSKPERIRRAWAQRLSGQYIAEAERLIDLAHKTAHGSWSPVFARSAHAGENPRLGQAGQAGQTRRKI